MAKMSVEEQLKEVNRLLSSVNPEDLKKLQGEEYQEALDILRKMEDILFDFKAKVDEK
jgi:hypothetical protein